jgi:hypothetical protein
MSDDNNNDTMLSRSGRSDPGGKLVKRCAHFAGLDGAKKHITVAN